MRAPLRPLPDSVTRWTTYTGILRWLDAVLAFLGLWWLTTDVFPAMPETERLTIAALFAAGAVMLPALRVRWRPISALVSLHVSRELRAGDHAWFIRPGDARLVLVTGRRRLR